MTQIKCEYVENPHRVRSGGDPIYCVHRNELGECGLKEIEMDELDSGWQAICNQMKTERDRLSNGTETK